MVIAYTTYLTWSALSHEPDDLCNPPGYFISGYDQNTGLSLQTIFSGVFVFVMLIYASFSTAMSASRLSKSNAYILIAGKEKMADHKTTCLKLTELFFDLNVVTVPFI